MKILISNYRYFISGGPEKYLFNITNELKGKGHEVIPFSIHHNKNQATEYAKYFIEPIGGRDKAYFREYKKDLKTIAQLIGRSFYSFQARKAIEKEISAEGPDVVFLLHFINKLSPSVIDGAKKAKKRVVVRLSDYFLLCPRFDFLDHHQICEECLKHSFLPALRKRCVQNSLTATMIRVSSMYFHNLLRIYDQVDAFVCPSAFLARKLVQAGFKSEKIHHVPTFIDASKLQPQYGGDYVLYYGRLAEEKGVLSLIKAFEQLPSDLTLKIVGEDQSDYGMALKKYVAQNKIGSVEFLGFKSGTELEAIIKNAKLVVVPSIWYENMPNVALESFAYGKPVIASNIGSMPEVVEDGVNGYLFEPNNSDDLALKIQLLNNDAKIAAMGMKAREIVVRQYNPALHYEKLIQILKG